MDPDFWLERWQQSQIGFHQADTEPLLQNHWPALGVPAGSYVFVPLCGKSLDMAWLAGQGYQVIGNELSQIAIDDFFTGQGLVPDKRTEAGFTVSSAAPYELWCGDFFDLPESSTRNVGGIYDRAALIALPPDMRQRYARKLTELSHSAAKALLITLEYDQSILPGPPHSVSSAEVESLFANEWQITTLVCEQTITLSPKFKQHGLEFVDQAVYILDPQGGTP
ncbi:MAG: thiopurine S-methyltransferase [Hyphomicrobiaceae bacterium]